MERKIIGYTTGVFDLFHIGHLNIIRQAKEHCDWLIVGVSTDELVISTKNKRPVISYEDRAAIVSALRYVDEVVPQENKDKYAAWKKYHFQKMFVGSDWRGTPEWDRWETVFAPLNVQIVYFPYTVGISSTILSNIIKGNSKG